MAQRHEQKGRPVVRWMIVLSVLLSLAVSETALAAPGDGVRVGPGRLRAGAEAGLRYDSQVGSGPFGYGGELVVVNPDDAIVKARAQLQLDVPGRDARLNVTGGFDWNQYLGVSARTEALSFFGADVNGALVVRPEGCVSFELSESFTRSDKTTNPVFGGGVLSMQNTTKARVRVRPGGGALEAGLGYELGANLYSAQLSGKDTSGICLEDPQCNPDLAPAFNALSHRLAMDAKWRFLPKTGLTLEAYWGLHDYLHGKSFTRNVGAQPLGAALGFGTLLSTKLSFLVKGGYSGLKLDTQGQPFMHNWSALAELGFKATETLQLRLGYTRFFNPVGGEAIYYGTDRGYAEVRTQLSRVVLTASGSVDLVSFGAVDRDDLAFAANLRGEYHFNKWLRLVSTAAFTHRTASNAPENEQSAYTYTRWEASVGLATLF